MSSTGLHGVIAAIATPLDASGAPDAGRFMAFARRLLDGGCDGLNVLGTTGEATSFTREQRLALMSAAASGLPRDRLMVGTGAAAVGDAVALTRAAAELGFAGALVLPPFYYKGVSDDGVVRYIAALVAATKDRPIPIFLYHFPALSGVPYTVGLVRRLSGEFGDRIAGLKDSSGDLAYAREVAGLAPSLKVFPSNEATLLEARSGPFAGCISATVNLNADLCGEAFRTGSEGALAAAVAIRKLFDGKPLVPGVKALIGDILGDPDWSRVVPPLTEPREADRTSLWAAYRAIRDRVA